MNKAILITIALIFAIPARQAKAEEVLLLCSWIDNKENKNPFEIDISDDHVLLNGKEIERLDKSSIVFDNHFITFRETVTAGYLERKIDRFSGELTSTYNLHGRTSVTGKANCSKAERPRRQF
jgi:hypothetical protein